MQAGIHIDPMVHFHLFLFLVSFFGTTALLYLFKVVPLHPYSLHKMHLTSNVHPHFYIFLIRTNQIALQRIQIIIDAFIHNFLANSNCQKHTMQNMRCHGNFKNKNDVWYRNYLVIARDLIVAFLVLFCWAQINKDYNNNNGKSNSNNITKGRRAKK